MKSEFEKTKQELTCTKRTLKDATITQRIQSQRNCLQKKVNKVSKLYEDTPIYLMTCWQNSELAETLSSLQKVLRPPFEIISVT